MKSTINRLYPAGVALVSGASGAIGSAVTARLANAGMQVVMLGRDEERLRVARDALGANAISRKRVHTAVINIGASDGFDAAFAGILARFPRIDLLVHAAGSGPLGDLLESTEQQWQDGLQGKLMGAVRLARAVCRPMAAAGGGQVILVNGVFAKEPDPLFPINSTVNCALLGFAKAISRDIARRGVRVNVVSPGPVESPLWRDTIAALARRLGTTLEQADRAVIDRIPLGMLASPDHVASAVEMLVNPCSDYLNGAVIDVDGGLTAAL